MVGTGVDPVTPRFQVGSDLALIMLTGDGKCKKVQFRGPLANPEDSRENEPQFHCSRMIQ